MDILIEEYKDTDLKDMITVWNEVVEDGVAFPQDEPLTEQTGAAFFEKQDFVGVARYDGNVVGLYILHPNNVGRCGHHANASYAVRKNMRGLKIGEKLVGHSLKKAKELHYKLLIFNAVVKGNDSAIHLYKKLGFTKVGEIPQGFLLKNGVFQDIIIFYHEL